MACSLASLFIPLFSGGLLQTSETPFQVAFNPITVNSIKRVLAKICKGEELSVSPGWIDHIAKGSGGDIRHAIMCLQYYSLRIDLMISSPLSNLVISTPKSEAGKSGCSFSIPRSRYDFNDGFIPLAVGRDETLSLFHGLGKFLHNKRDPMPAIENGILSKFPFHSL